MMKLKKNFLFIKKDKMTLKNYNYNFKVRFINIFK